MDRAGPVLWSVEHSLVSVQLFLFIFNLIPLYPLDGGRMFHALLWGFLRRRHGPAAYARATLGTVWISRLTAAAGVIYAFWTQEFWLALIFVWAWTGTESLRKQLSEGAEEDYSFGYDFSRGFTSLERSVDAEDETADETVQIADGD